MGFLLTKTMSSQVRSKGREIFGAWKRFGAKIGNFQARLILSVFYFLIFGPFALLIRLASDPLGIKAGTRHGWVIRGESEGSKLEQASKQF